MEKKVKGVTYSASNQKDLDEMIERDLYQRSIFYRSTVYTYSCYARELDDGTVEFIQMYNNGKTSDTTTFSSVDEFWDKAKL